MVSQAAGALGVRAGMGVAEARALAAGLAIRPWDDAAIRRAITEVTAALVAASPQVTPAAPGLWWVGADGVGGSAGEAALVQALLAIAARWHPDARVALASCCVAARAGTFLEGGAPARLVPPGGDADFLALAPLALLPMDGEMRAACAALGLRTIGALAALDAFDVEARWGDAGLRAWRLARADDPRRPMLARLPVVRAVAADLPAPADTLEPVLFLVKAAVDRLVAQALAEAHAIAELEVTLVLDDVRRALPTGPGGAEGRTVARRVVAARPVARAAPLLELCRAALEGLTRPAEDAAGRAEGMLAAPILAVTVAIVREVPLAAEQGDLLALGWRDPAAAAAAFARLRATLGAEAVVVPMVRDAHRVEEQGEWRRADERTGTVADERTGGRAEWSVVHGPSSGTKPPSASPPVRSSARAASARLLTPPEPITREGDVAFRWRGRRYAVTQSAGPERLDGDWWRGPYAREYWRWAGPDGAFLVYRDLLEAGEAWYVQGWED
ncbi:MAG: hypothetical protein SFU84_06815 [Gemmatimonadales bacterium]|nr:hypothetical protein [Gemmatimonadales bacterium]